MISKFVEGIVTKIKKKKNEEERGCNNTIGMKYLMLTRFRGLKNSSNRGFSR